MRLSVRPCDRQCRYEKALKHLMLHDIQSGLPRMTRSERMKLTVERERDVLFVDVTCRIDSAIEFEEGVRNAIAETDRGLVMDFRNLAYIDGAGLRVILAVAKLFVAWNRRLVLCNLSDSIHNLSEICRFDKIIPIHPTRDAARTSVRAELTGG